MGRYNAQEPQAGEFDRTPEQKLLSALIEQAILDFLNDYKKPSDELLRLYEEYRKSGKAITPWAKSKKLSHHTADERFSRVRRYLDASDNSEPGKWLFSDSRGPFSFLYALEHLFENPESMAAYIRKKLQEKKNDFTGKSFRRRVQTA